MTPRQRSSTDENWHQSIRHFSYRFGWRRSNLMGKVMYRTNVITFLGFPRCKNPWYFFSVSLAHDWVCLLMVSWLFCFLCFTSSVSLTGVYTEDEPFLFKHSSSELVHVPKQMEGSWGQGWTEYSGHPEQRKQRSSPPLPWKNGTRNVRILSLIATCALSYLFISSGQKQRSSIRGICLFFFPLSWWLLLWFTRYVRLQKNLSTEIRQRSGKDGCRLVLSCHWW